MEQIIKINVPEGKIAEYDKETQTIRFVNKQTRSKSWEEFCHNHPDAIGEWYVTNYGSINVSTIYDEKRTHRYGNAYLSTKEDAEGILALIQLTRLHDEWVGDWKPDFYGRNTEQCSITQIKDTIDIHINYYCNELLTFPNYDLAVEFKECFNDLITKAKRFI